MGLVDILICVILQLEGSPLVEAQNDKFSGKAGSSHYCCFDCWTRYLPDCCLLLVSGSVDRVLTSK